MNSTRRAASGMFAFVDPSPRLFCIPATDSPLVAVIRRDSGKWWNIGEWDTHNLRFEPGAWFHGTLYPQRCDLSPDGRWFSYFALKPMAKWEGGSVFVAISRFPWLKALVAWNEGTTYSRGIHFGDRFEGGYLGDPAVGDCQVARKRYGLQRTAPIQFAVERRRGWKEAPDSPQRDERDMWDEHREAIIEKEPVCGPHRHQLRVKGLYAAFRGMPETWLPSESVYTLTRNGHNEAIDEATWADWDAHGRLLVATRDGRIQVRKVERGRHEVIFEADMRTYSRKRGPAPNWASQW